VSDGGAAAVGVLDRGRKPIGIGISVVLVLIAIVLATRGNGGGEPQVVETPPHLVGIADLSSLGHSLGHRVYWAGKRSRDRLELSEEADGSAYLRYLPPGVEAGDPRTQFLTVGTYPVADAQAALRRIATKTGSVLKHVAGGGLVLVDPSSRGSVYLAYAGSNLQIEVYDPAPGMALRLIRSGAIRPVG
jgi:hypothetical protein